MVSTFRPGMIAKSDSRGAPKKPNPVAQARILHSMFRLPKGHWPPRNDVIDDCIYLDMRYLGNQLEKAAQLAFAPDPAQAPTTTETTRLTQPPPWATAPTGIASRFGHNPTTTRTSEPRTPTPVWTKKR